MRTYTVNITMERIEDAIVDENYGCHNCPIRNELADMGLPVLSVLRTHVQFETDDGFVAVHLPVVAKQFIDDMDNHIDQYEWYARPDPVSFDIDVPDSVLEVEPDN